MQKAATAVITHSPEIPLATIVDGRIVDPIGSTVRVPISMIKPFDRNPRKNFPQRHLTNIAESLGERSKNSDKDNRDVEKAVQVTLEDDGRFVELVDGECRLRGGTMADLTHLSCFIRGPMTIGEKLLSAFRQNLFQEPMNVIEEASGYQDLMDEWRWDIHQLAVNIGKKVDPIKRVMKYLRLNKKLQSLLLYEKIDKGVALVIGEYENPQHQDHMLDKLIEVSKERGGKPIHPNEATRICRKEAEIHEFPLRKARKGKRPSTHAQLTARNLRMRLKQVNKALAEVRELDEETLQNLKKPTFLEIEGDLIAARKEIDAVLSNLSHLA